MNILLERFIRKVEFTESCWLWTKCKSSKDYGVLSVNGKGRYAHRVSYELFKGEIPADMVVCHSCDTPSCVNPDHLFLGTMRDNAIDKLIKGRSNHVNADADIRSEITKMVWAGYTPEERVVRINAVADSLIGKEFTPTHLENLRAAHAQRRGKPGASYGDMLPQTCLTPEQVGIIRDQYAGGRKQQELADEFGVSRACISQVVRGKVFKYLFPTPVQRFSGYGTRNPAELSIHGNFGRKRTAEQKETMKEARKLDWQHRKGLTQ